MWIGGSPLTLQYLQGKGAYFGLVSLWRDSPSLILYFVIKEVLTIAYEMTEVAEELVRLNEDIKVDHLCSEIFLASLVCTLHLRLTHLLDLFAQCLPHILGFLDIFHARAVDELMNLCDVVYDLITYGSELCTISFGDRVKVVIHVLGRYLCRTL